MYAMTLKDRGRENRDKWLNRGFKLINRNPDALFNYWVARLKKRRQQDMDLFEQTFEEFNQNLNSGPLNEDISILGPQLWEEFHNRAKGYNGGIQAERGWLSSFAKRIPCYECREHFITLVKHNPPDLSSSEAYLKWGCDIHNFVNKKLGKPFFEISRLYLESPTNPHQFPSLLKQVESFSTASLKFLKSGFQTTPPEIFAKRTEICKVCPEWDAEAINGTGRCRKCGCSTWAKLRLPTEKCPLDKWGPVNTSTPEQQQQPSTD